MKEKNPPLGGFLVFLESGEGLDQTSVFESFVRTLFSDGAEALGRNRNSDRFVEFRDENTLLLKVNLLAYHARWVELCCTNTIAVPASNQ